MMSKAGTAVSGFRSWISLQILLQHEYTFNTPRQIDCISEDFQTYEYYLFLFGDEFLDALIGEENYFERSP